MDDDLFVEPRFASRGRAYVYLLPCREQDLLKVGFSRDPWQRFHTLHRRFHDFFDLDRGLLVEAERVAQARRIERRLHAAWAAHRAPAPLAVPDSAAGHTEWYRGIDAQVTTLARQLAHEDSLPCHEPLRPWLAARLAGRAEALYGWSETMLAQARLEREYTGAAGPCERALLDTLALCEALGPSLADVLPEAVLDWYRHGPHRSLFGA